MWRGRGRLSWNWRWGVGEVLVFFKVGEDVDEGVFEVALLAVEVDDAKVVAYHPREDVGGLRRVFSVDTDTSSILSGL